MYHDGRSAEGIVPRDLVYSCRPYRREMRGCTAPRHLRACRHRLVRLDTRVRRARGQLRVPSGVSTSATGGHQRVFPGLFNRYTSSLRALRQALLATLQALAPPSRPTRLRRADARCVTPPIRAAFLALGWPWRWRGRDLLATTTRLHGTTSGLLRVDVIYRRVATISHPLSFRRDSLWRPPAAHAYRAANVSLAMRSAQASRRQAISLTARDHHSTCPMSDPANVQTFLSSDPSTAIRLENLINWWSSLC